MVLFYFYENESIRLTYDVSYVIDATTKERPLFLDPINIPIMERLQTLAATVYASSPTRIV